MEFIPCSPNPVSWDFFHPPYLHGLDLKGLIPGGKRHTPFPFSLQAYSKEEESTQQKYSVDAGAAVISAGCVKVRTEKTK